MIDQRAVSLRELQAASYDQLLEYALSWAGQIRVEANTHSSVAKQVLIDILLELKERG